MAVYAPTRPQSYILLADACLLGAQGVLAQRQLEKALELNSAMKSGGAPKRQWLTAEEEARLRKMLGLTPHSSGAIIQK